jgi:hypothetical protein
MSRDELAALAQALAPAQQAQAAQRCFEQRGGQRRRAPGAGSQGLLSGTDRVLMTIVYLRQICSQNVLSDLLGINANSIGQAIAETCQLLTDHHRTIAATTLRFTTASALAQFVSNNQPEPPRSRVSDWLANPALTGLSRPELAAMTNASGTSKTLATSDTATDAAAGNAYPDPRRRVHPEDHRRRASARHGALPAQAVHPGHPRRTVSGQPAHHRRGRPRGPIVAQDGFTPTPTGAQFATAAEILAALSGDEDTGGAGSRAPGFSTESAGARCAPGAAPGGAAPPSPGPAATPAAGSPRPATAPRSPRRPCRSSPVFSLASAIARVLAGLDTTTRPARLANSVAIAQVFPVASNATSSLGPSPSAKARTPSGAVANLPAWITSPPCQTATCANSRCTSSPIHRRSRPAPNSVSIAVSPSRRSPP